MAAALPAWKPPGLAPDLINSPRVLNPRSGTTGGPGLGWVEDLQFPHLNSGHEKKMSDPEEKLIENLTNDVIVIIVIVHIVMVTAEVPWTPTEQL